MVNSIIHCVHRLIAVLYFDFQIVNIIIGHLLFVLVEHCVLIKICTWIRTLMSMTHAQYNAQFEGLFITPNSMEHYDLA